MSEETTLVAEHMRAELAAEPSPVTAIERINSIDMLRGIAVAGILVMNIYAFAMPFTAYMNPLVYGGTEWYNLGTWFVTHILFDQKFLPIFSMLYGAGLVMMADRAAKREVKFGGIWYRRNFWLLLIGAAHGYLLWFGDILFHYALMGMLIYLFRNLRPRNLILIACVILPVALLSTYGGGAYMQKLQKQSGEIIALQDAGEELTEEQREILEDWEAMSIFWGPPEEMVQKDLEGYRKSYSEIVAYRAPAVIMMQTQATFGFILWRVGGLMLLGMALMKLGILSGKRDKGFYRKLLLTAYAIGLPIVLFSAYDLDAHQWEPQYMFQLGGMANYVGSIFVSLGHVSLFMLIIKSGVAHALMNRFAALGRMALTNYLMHSVILTTVFYGYGFGLYGTVPRALQMLFVLAVIGFQLWFSPAWLRRYRFGPVEWLWRSLTYWQCQPMRRSTVS